MIVQLDDSRKYLFVFHHELPKNQVKMGVLSSIPHRGGTSCFLYRLNKDGRVKEDEVVLKRYYKDKFCKETGRKNALQRLLENNFTKSERAIIWDAYLNRAQ